MSELNYAVWVFAVWVFAVWVFAVWVFAALVRGFSGSQPVLVVGVCGLVASSCASHAHVKSAPPPVDVSVEQSVPGSFSLEVSQISDRLTCARHHSHPDVCVTQMQRSLQVALDQLLRRFIRSGGESKQRYRASFRVLDFSQHATTYGAGDFEVPELRLRWRFDLLGPSGASVVQVTERTDRDMRRGMTRDSAVRALLTEVVEDIGDALNEGAW